MAKPPSKIDGKLADWSDVASEREWPALLIGNGASIAQWRHFSYDSLYHQAGLKRRDRDLFGALGGTTSFELVLDALRVSQLVCEQLGHNDRQVARRYASIRSALIAGVNDVHVPWLTAEPNLEDLGRALIEHETIYSTNYDLLVYWGLMALGAPRRWGDVFWNPGNEFDDANTTPKWDMTLVHYLHGGLHIYKTASGVTVKRVAPAGRTLLDLLGTPHQGSDVPLFVSEATSDDKMKVIRSSDYLSFAYGALEDESEPMVIFGNSLSAQDEHIVRAINRWPKRELAIALRPGRKLDVIANKTRLLQTLKGPVRFFESESHPLGDPSLQLAP